MMFLPVLILAGSVLRRKPTPVYFRNDLVSMHWQVLRFEPRRLSNLVFRLTAKLDQECQNVADDEDLSRPSRR
jgi:hypothetical protein